MLVIVFRRVQEDENHSLQKAILVFGEVNACLQTFIETPQKHGR